MEPNSNIQSTHAALGEFVILFQLVENLYRQIGWFLLDPERANWPPMNFRRESNRDLIDGVTKLYVDTTKRYSFPGGAEKAADMIELRSRFHELRRYRNVLLHSTYIALDSLGGVHGYVRSNPSLGVDPDTGELIHDQEIVTAEKISDKMREYSEFILRLNMNYVQAIHWYPFSRFSETI